MLYDHTLKEIQTNVNTGVEYEIALFYQLLSDDEKNKVMKAIKNRCDSGKVNDIIGYTSVTAIIDALKNRGLVLKDVSFETQNDKVGPSDIVMYVIDKNKQESRIGLSVKYANTCTLNVTGRRFITEQQIAALKKVLPIYTDKYVNEMTSLYGNVSNWFRQRKPSSVTDEYIDLIRNAVIENWENVDNKVSLLQDMFHADSPIEFWVVTYTNKGYYLSIEPKTIERSRSKDVIVKKYQTSYVAFYLDGNKVGHMQVKFNNGILEKCKKKKPDVVCQGVSMSFGRPFSSWNFSVENE